MIVRVQCREEYPSVPQKLRGHGGRGALPRVLFVQGSLDEDPAFVISITAINERLSGWYDEWGEDHKGEARPPIREVPQGRHREGGVLHHVEPFDTASTLAFAKVENPFFRVTKVIVAKGIFHLPPWLFANMAYLEEVVLTDALHVPAGLCYGCALKALPTCKRHQDRLVRLRLHKNRGGAPHSGHCLQRVVSAFKDCKNVTGVVFGERSRCYWLQRECFRGTSTQFGSSRAALQGLRPLGGSAFANTR